MRTRKQYNINDISPLEDIEFSISCGLESIRQAAIENLAQDNFSLNQGSTLHLIIDAPTGYALHALETSVQEQRSNVVITWNCCVEYWQDICELGPAVFVAEDGTTISNALKIAHLGNSCRIAPQKSSLLTKLERKILLLIAKGYSNQSIAIHLNVQCQSVRNSLTSIYQKLSLNDRSEAILYYWGIWCYRQNSFYDTTEALELLKSKNS